jgi:DNA-binding transcriptional ArsR family regulator
MLLRRAEATRRTGLARTNTLDRSAYLILRRLDEHGPRSVKAVADALGLDGSTVNRQVTAMERDGLVRRTRATDSRLTLVQPTAVNTPYPQHAMNYLATEPKHAPPVYDPAIVADAILACAEKPHRNLRVGGGAKMFTMMEKTAPGLADKMKMSHFEQQHADEPPRDDDTLYNPRPHDASVRGEYPGHVMRRSMYTAAAKRPKATAVAALGVAVVGLGFLAARAFGGRAD